MSIADAFAEFILACRADGFSEQTITWYSHLLQESPDNVIGWLWQRSAVDLQHVTTPDLRAYIVWLRDRPNANTGEKRSEYTVNAFLRALHKFFNWCSAEYGIGNPMSRIAYPKMPTAAPRAVDLRDVALMLESCADDVPGRRNAALIAFLLDTGVRAGGLCGLKASDLDWNKRRATVTEKGDLTRQVVFSSAAADVLFKWFQLRDVNAYTFYNLDTAEPLTVDGLRNILRNVARRAGVTGRVNPHSFRHAFAREYLKAGGDLGTLAALMGHRQKATTLTHYAVFSLDEAAQQHELYSPMKQLKAGG